MECIDNDPKEEWLKLYDFLTSHNINIDIKKRSRWYNSGRNAISVDLIVVFYNNAVKAKKIDGREVLVGQTPKAKSVAEETGGGIFVDNELVAVRSKEKIIHFLTQDEQIVRKILEPIFKSIESLNEEKYKQALKKFCLSRQNSGFDVFGEQIRDLNVQIELLNSDIGSMVEKLELLEKIDYTELQNFVPQISEVMAIVPFLELVSLNPDTGNKQSISVVVSRPSGSVNTDAVALELEKSIQNAINSIYYQSMDIADALARKRRNLNSCVERLNIAEGKYQELLKLYEDMDGSINLLYKKILKIDGYQSFKFLDGSIKAITHPVVLESGGYKYSLGEFLVSVIQVNTYRAEPKLEVRVAPHSNTTNSAGYYHPHVYGGILCAGNMLEAMKIAGVNWEIIDLFTIANLLLRNYNPESPYRHIHHWPQIKE